MIYLFKRCNKFVIFLRVSKTQVNEKITEVIMRRKIGKTGKRTAVCAVSAALLFSSMNLDILAADVNGLPSAGIDFFLSSNATSVKSL